MSQLSNIPKGWRISTLPEAYFFQEGPGVRKWQFRDKGIKLLNGSNINHGLLDTSNTRIYLDENEVAGKYRHFLVDAGDLVIASSGIVVENFHNKIAFVKKEDLPLCMNTSTIRFKTLDEKQASLFYLKFFLKTRIFKAQIQKLITGTAQLNFGPSHLKKILIPLPPLEDQVRIATVLTRAEQLIAKRKESITALDALLKSTFLEMFGDPVRNEKGWERLTGVQYTEMLTVGVVVRPASYYAETGVIALRSLNIKPNRISLENLVYFSEEASNGPLAKSVLRKGDVVVIRTGLTGIAAVIPADLDGANCIDLIIVRPKQSVLNPYYLTFLLNSDRGKKLVSSKEVGGIQKHFNIGAINKIAFPIPPLALQNQFAAIVEKVEALKAKYQQSLDELENLYGSLSQRAFKGELDLSGVRV